MLKIPASPWRRAYYEVNRPLHATLSTDPDRLSWSSTIWTIWPSPHWSLFQKCLIHRSTIVQFSVVMQPLPQLGSTDFRRRSILHQIEKWNATLTSHPRFQISQSDTDISSQSGLGRAPSGTWSNSIGGGIFVSGILSTWFGVGINLSNTSEAKCTRPGWATPSAIVTVPSFAFFVFANRCQRCLVDFRIVLHGNKRSHSTHGVGTSSIKSLLIYCNFIYCICTSSC